MDKSLNESFDRGNARPSKKKPFENTVALICK